MNRHGIWGKLSDLPKAEASWEAGEWGAVPFQTFPLAAPKVCICNCASSDVFLHDLSDFCSPHPHGRSWFGTTQFAYSHVGRDSNSLLNDVI